MSIDGQDNPNIFTKAYNYITGKSSQKLNIDDKIQMKK